VKHLLATCLVLVALQAQAQTFCPESNIVVAADSAPYADPICEVTPHALSQLSACGLTLARPVTVDVVPQMAPDAEHCLGVFRCEGDRIEILTPAAFDAKTTARRLYGGISGEALFAAVLTHELSHAAVRQAPGGREISVTGDEYIAYAMQIAAMAPADRNRFLSNEHLPETISLDQFTPFRASVFPSRFAALAYEHFAQPQNGCAFVHKLLSGETVLGTSESKF